MQDFNAATLGVRDPKPLTQTGVNNNLKQKYYEGFFEKADEQRREW